MHQRKVKLSAVHCGINLVQHVLLCGVGWGGVGHIGHFSIGDQRTRSSSPNHPHVSHLAVDQVFLNGSVRKENHD